MKPTPPKNATVVDNTASKATSTTSASNRITRRQCLLLGASGVAGASLALAGCGFALRGNLQYAFKTIHIAGNSQSPVAVLLARLLYGQVQVVETAANADMVLTVLTDRTERVASALSASAQVREVELRQFFDFSLKAANSMAQADPVQIRINRFVSYSESQATAKEAEFDLLYRDMRNDAARQVLRRLSMYKPA